MNNDYISIGLIVGKHKFKPIIKVQLYGDNPKIVIKCRCYLSNKQNIQLAYHSTNKRNTNYLLLNPNLIDIDSLIKQEIFVTRNSLPELQDNQYYQCDLLGLTVNNENNNIIGKIKAIHNFGAGDIIEIQTINNKNVMITMHAIQSINIINGTVKIDQNLMI